MAKQTEEQGLPPGAVAKMQRFQLSVYAGVNKESAEQAYEKSAFEHTTK